MKNLILFGILVFALSCKKEDDNPFDSSKLPSGRANISFLSTGSEVFTFETNTPTSVANLSNGLLEISGTTKTSVPNYTFVIYLDQWISTGKYAKGDTGTASKYVDFSLKNNISGKEYSSLNSNYTLEITKKTDKLIEGTFSATKMYSISSGIGSSVVEVKSGKFAANLL
jgi:hypothetical protein